MNKAMVDRVVWFVARRTGIEIERLNPETRLLHDLGIEGDDADEFIQAFAKEFDVDMSEFTFADFFGPEPSLADPLWFLPRHAARRKGERTALSIKSLALSAERGKWVVADQPKAPSDVSTDA